MSRHASPSPSKKIAGARAPWVGVRFGAWNATPQTRPRGEDRGDRVVPRPADSEADPRGGAGTGAVGGWGPGVGRGREPEGTGSTGGVGVAARGGPVVSSGAPADPRPRVPGTALGDSRGTRTDLLCVHPRDRVQDRLGRRPEPSSPPPVPPTTRGTGSEARASLNGTDFSGLAPWRALHAR